MNKDRRKELDRAATILDKGQGDLAEAREKFVAACDTFDMVGEELTSDKDISEVEDWSKLLNAEELATFEKAKAEFAKAKSEYLESVSNIQGELEEAQSIVESCKDEEEEYKDNMPENMQGGDRYYRAEEAVNYMESALESIGEAIDTLGVSDETDTSDLVDLDIEDDLNSASSDISSAAE